MIPPKLTLAHLNLADGQGRANPAAWLKPLRMMAVLMIAGFLSACVGDRSPEVLNSPTYKAGYADGCRTANTRVAGVKSTVHKNQALYEQDELYRDGWGDGYANCGGSLKTNPTDIFSDEFSQPRYDPTR